MAQKRESMPTCQKIADWWVSEEGQNRIRELEAQYDISLGSKLGSIDQDCAHCWACDMTPRSTPKRYNAKDLGLERCHIVAHAHGGSGHPSNLLIMCSDCHKASPDLLDEGVFWWWFNGVKSDLSNKVQKLMEVIPADLKHNEVSTITNTLLERIKATQPLICRGHLPTSVYIGLLHQVISKRANTEDHFTLKEY